MREKTFFIEADEGGKSCTVLCGVLEPKNDDMENGERGEIIYDDIMDVIHCRRKGSSLVSCI